MKKISTLYFLFVLIFIFQPILAAQTQRCNLKLAPDQCLDPASLDGSTVNVPLHVTRINKIGGLSLCMKTSPTAEPVDLVVIIDQSGSMTPAGAWGDDSVPVRTD